MRAADYVFETLSRAILAGELAPGSVLATQRELSTQFGVSPLVVRQATHRLEELGLVRVRQGSTTIVLDPNQASDVRLMQLRLELATPGDRLALAARESQALSPLPLLALAERRINEAELTELERLVDALPESQPPRDTLQFLVQFWGQIARSTRNPLVEQQFRWWASVMQELEKRTGGGDPLAPRRLLPKSVFRGLIRCLRKRKGAPEFWLKVITPLFDWIEAQPMHAMHASPPIARGSNGSAATATPPTSNAKQARSR
jgi:DNA-binding FadR family transcriptional regulator